MLFSTQTLRSIIAGDSAVDLPSLQTETRGEALAFMRAYGLDPGNEDDARHIENVRGRAIALLESKILRPGQAIPASVRTMEDLPTLLMWASGTALSDAPSPGAARQRQAWSCVVLRVCHTFAHALRDLNESYGPLIRKQIADRFEAHLSRDDEGLRLGRGEDAVPLLSFDVRRTKTVDAACMKMLRAVGNVATEVFDWMGVRFVVPTPIDALFVVRYLRANNVIGYPNIIPGRSRNSLVDLESISPLLPRIESEFSSLPDKAAELRRLVPDLAQRPSDHRAHNEHSAEGYRAIQFTCREMVRLSLGERAQPARFFFPYEVQILDAASYEASHSGPASHAHYKARQLDAVRARVLAGT